MKRLQDKIAVITGAGSGIGKETALLFLEHGAKVVLADINQETLEETFEIIKQKKLDSDACISLTDVSSEDNIKSMIDQAVDHFGGLDVLFNNAGIGGAVGPITHIDADEWDRQEVKRQSVWHHLYLQPILIDNSGVLLPHGRV